MFRWLEEFNEGLKKTMFALGIVRTVFCVFQRVLCVIARESYVTACPPSITPCQHSRWNILSLTHACDGRWVLHTHTHACMYTHTCASVYTHTHTHTNTHAHKHTHTRVLMYTHTHTHCVTYTLYYAQSLKTVSQLLLLTSPSKLVIEAAGTERIKFHQT